MLNENRSNNPFSGKVRVRVCGILEENNKILLLKHKNIGPAGYLWSPPGGGVEFGESIHEALKKEFKEETDLEVEIKKYLFTHEHIDQLYHAIELFFEVKRIKGTLKLGFDPELPENNQILTEARFFTRKEIIDIPSNVIHRIFKNLALEDKITDLKGLYTFKH